MFLRSLRQARAGVLLTTVVLAGVLGTGCMAPGGSPPSAPPVDTYEQAWMSTIQREIEYAHGYASVGYSPSIMTIPGHPFTAQRTYTEWDRNGQPGDPPIVTTTVTIARDGAGRVHYESSRRTGNVDVLISDPVDHFNYRYMVSRRAQVNPTAEKCSQARMRDITSQNALPSLPVGLLPVVYRPGEQSGGAQPQYPQVKDQKEELGTRDFDGVLAYGQRTLHVVSNKFGTKPMTIERWFSPDLGLTMLDSSDITGQNRFSTQTHDLQFAEPDPSLFGVPSGYSFPAQILSCNRRR